MSFGALTAFGFGGSGSGGGGTFDGADNGLSVDPVTGKVVLGNDMGDVAKLAELINTREIVTNGNSLFLSESPGGGFGYSILRNDSIIIEKSNAAGNNPYLQVNNSPLNFSDIVLNANDTGAIVSLFHYTTNGTTSTIELKAADGSNFGNKIVGNENFFNIQDITSGNEWFAGTNEPGVGSNFIFGDAGNNNGDLYLQITNKNASIKDSTSSNELLGLDGNFNQYFIGDASNTLGGNFTMNNANDAFIRFPLGDLLNLSASVGQYAFGDLNSGYGNGLQLMLDDTQNQAQLSNADNSATFFIQDNTYRTRMMSNGLEIIDYAASSANSSLSAGTLSLVGQDGSVSPQLFLTESTQTLNAILTADALGLIFNDSAANTFYEFIKSSFDTRIGDISGAAGGVIFHIDQNGEVAMLTSNLGTASYGINGNTGFTGTGAFTNLTIEGGIITAAS